MNTSVQRKQAQFTFSPHLYNLAESLAHSRGLSLAEYVRYLIVREVDKKDIELVHMQSVADEALKEYREGKGVVTMSNEKDIDAYLNSLDTE